MGSSGLQRCKQALRTGIMGGGGSGGSGPRSCGRKGPSRPPIQKPPAFWSTFERCPTCSKPSSALHRPLSLPGQGLLKPYHEEGRGPFPGRATPEVKTFCGEESWILQSLEPREVAWPSSLLQINKAPKPCYLKAAKKVQGG